MAAILHISRWGLCFSFVHCNRKLTNQLMQEVCADFKTNWFEWLLSNVLQNQCIAFQHIKLRNHTIIEIQCVLQWWSYAPCSKLVTISFVISAWRNKHCTWQEFSCSVRNDETVCICCWFGWLSSGSLCVVKGKYLRVFGQCKIKIDQNRMFKNGHGYITITSLRGQFVKT